MIDWHVATSTGVRWVRPGPQVSMAEARKVVAELRQLAAAVAEPVRELTGLPGSADDGKVAVVDVRVAGGSDAGASANVPRGSKA